MSADEDFLEGEQVDKYLAQIEDAIERNDTNRCRAILMEAVKEFVPQCDVADLVSEKILSSTAVPAPESIN